MFKGNERQHTNGLLTSIDWLGFTLMGDEDPAAVMNLLGYTESEFSLCSRGASGYRQQYRHAIFPIAILFDGNEGMGIHVDISGSAIADVISHFQKIHTSPTPFGEDAFLTTNFNLSIFACLLREILACAHITRLDFAIDDMGAKYYTLPDLSSILGAGNYVSKFRSYKEIKENKNAKTCIGHTIYLGSRVSDMMLRIYDKQLEQNKKRKASGEEPLTEPWVRWEMELKRERAQVAARLISSSMNLNEVIVGILSNYFRIIELATDSNKTRCKIAEKWLDFLDGITKLSLYVAPITKTLDKVRNWLMRQVSTSLAAILVADEGDTSFIHKLLESGKSRLKLYHLDLIRQAQGVTV